MVTLFAGKYDQESRDLAVALQAVGVVLIVIEGDRGNGISVTTREPDLLPVLPALLRVVAEKIEQDNQRAAN